MEKKIISVFLLLFPVVLSAQVKRVLLEEYTGAYCGNCPLGAQYIDSMLTLYPDLIPVSVHGYSIPDAMDFPQIDTLNSTYTQGAPLAAIDRICTGSSSDLTAVFVNQWSTRIQQRLSVPASLTLTIVPSWNSFTRNVTADVNIDILSNMPAGDYRLNLYVVEDSVTGTGAGYDQENFYDTDTSSPFYGMGNPIVGFVHRHVARALLPSSWGLQGLIPASPATGQNFNHVFNYALPASYNENRVHLVAFVYRFSSNHMGDEVLNVTDEKLIQSPAAVFNNESLTGKIFIHRDSFMQLIMQFTRPVEDAALTLYDVCGKKIKTIKNISGSEIILPIEKSASGIYFYRIMEESEMVYDGKVMID
jgi:hypothetical protein